MSKNGRNGYGTEVIQKGLTKKEYEKELLRLQAELCKLQEWVKYAKLRVVVVFEGRDAAGKGARSAPSRRR